MKSLFETTRYFNDYFEIERTENRLPHLEQEGGTYFLTFRLADSLPQKLLGKLKEEKRVWILEHPKPWDEETVKAYHQKFSAKVESWLDSGMGGCRLKRKDALEIVAESFFYGEGDRYELHSFVIMPNHVHVLLRPREGWTLDKLVGSWKKFTARKVNEIDGAAGEFWAKSYFDRLIRDAGHLASVIRYIRKNPKVAGLKEGEAMLWESERVRSLNLR